MGVCAAVGAIAGAAIAAGSAIHQGQVQSNYRDYQAEQAQADADAARGRAQVEAERIRKAGKQQRSRAIAALAGSGVDVDSGTALQIDQTIGKNAEQDAFQTIASGDSKAAHLNADAEGYGLMAGQSKTAGYIGGASNLLIGATNNGRGWKKTGTGG